MLIVHIYLSATTKNNNWCAVSRGSITLKSHIDLRGSNIAHWKLTLFWYFAIIYFTGLYFYILYLIFCDSDRVGDGQKAFFDTVLVEYLQILEELFEWQTQ